ncbi:MAG TPA: DinB family protein [Agriterribacter sp.]|nr:DinB family protein [Agriterribacter sp.]
MAIITSLIGELKHEASNTRKILLCVPDEMFDWKPHEKSMSLSQLANHIAELPRWIHYMMTGTGFNFVQEPFKRLKATSKSELIEGFDAIIREAVELLEKANDEELAVQWKLSRGEVVIFELPRKVAIRNLVMNHIIHHRGQLSVYLRLLNVPVPGLYGPSADER